MTFCINADRSKLEKKIGEREREREGGGEEESGNERGNNSTSRKEE